MVLLRSVMSPTVVRLYLVPKSKGDPKRAALYQNKPAKTKATGRMQHAKTLAICGALLLDRASITNFISNTKNTTPTTTAAMATVGRHPIVSASKKAPTHVSVRRSHNFEAQ